MNNTIKDGLHKINYLSSEIEALYHLASIRLGLSDSESMVLYTIYNEDGTCMLSSIYKLTGISKQTINSAVRGLEKKNIISLAKLDGKSKQVTFTEQGKVYAERTIARLCKAEAAAFADWSEEEVQTIIRLLGRFIDSFGREIDGMEDKEASGTETEILEGDSLKTGIKKEL